MIAAAPTITCQSRTIHPPPLESMFTSPRLPLLVPAFLVLFSVESTLLESRTGATERLPPEQWQTLFDSQVRPIFENHCFDCHGPDVQEGGLRLDELRSIRRGGQSGEPAIMPGDPPHSHLLRLVTSSDPAEQMPPNDARLSETQLAVLREWIATAPTWESLGLDNAADLGSSEHWSFQPISNPVPPATVAFHNQVDDAVSYAQAAGPIDQFIRFRLAANGLQPSPAASRSSLIRRLYLDLLGLPPKADQIEAFVNDQSPHAYEQLVDQLLSDPAYGERWGTYWLDLVRFAETDGYETNRERPNAWPFRDYVIESLNMDKPFDRFLQEHLAGDQLGQPIATGYLVAGTRDIVKSPDIVLTKTQRQNELDDIINTTGTAMLGLTLGCARCHNHKFDPVSQSDYYALQAVFAGVQHGDRTLSPDETRQQQIHDTELAIRELEDLLAPFRVAENSLRAAVTPTGNVEQFAATKTQYLKFTMLATTGGEPCIDELEVFSTAQQNVALASAGTIATASGTIAGYPIHKLEHINDGQYGNERSWISSTANTGWIELAFAAPTEINRIVWARDRNGRYTDRLATVYRIETSLDRETWQLVSSSDDRLAFGQTAPPVRYDFTSAGVAQAASEQQVIWEARLKRLENLRQQLEILRQPKTVYAGTFTQPEATFRLFRGDPLATREAVAPNTVALLGDLGLDASASDGERRLRLAQWIVQPDNRLTARVIANRLWQHHFGTGMVPTPSDFGKAGVSPSHPELLDYLASNLISGDWSLKRVHREILLSATYQQSSAPNAQALKADAGNKWLWRFTPRRLEAEAIRDSVLSVSGVLDRTMGGAGFSAFEVELENVRHYHPKTSYGPHDWRRMIYMTKVRQEQDSVFGIFDCPDGATTVPSRGRSTTPLQALNLFNSLFMVQQASLFAQSLMRQFPDSTEAQINDAYWRCYGRQASPEEIEIADKFLATYGLESFCRALLNSNEFLFLQ